MFLEWESFSDCAFLIVAYMFPYKGNRQKNVSMCPLVQLKYFEHNCIFVNVILYQHVMLGKRGKGCQKVSKPINGLSSIISLL